ETLLIEIFRRGSFGGYLTTDFLQVGKQTLRCRPISNSKPGHAKQEKTKTGFGVEPTGTLLKCPQRVCSPRGAPAPLTGRCPTSFGLSCSLSSQSQRDKRQRDKLKLVGQFTFVLFSEGGTKSQREGLMVRIVCSDAGSLAYFALVPIGLGDLEGHAPDLPRSDDFVILAARAPAGRADTLDLQINVSFILDFKRVGKRSARLHRTERMLE